MHEELGRGVVSVEGIDHGQGHGVVVAAREVHVGLSIRIEQVGVIDGQCDLVDGAYWHFQRRAASHRADRLWPWERLPLEERDVVSILLCLLRKSSGLPQALGN